ncbi:MAG: transcriptional repressor [Calditerrivibrio sp.]|nr:transcriptional repressor [Calditerrivibrio sp.]MCA1932305.1 transcriptional repressor [Calditerrivibrio sp.]MCA1981162.1 transcriptional repressor [Calditerrivibrio sp.]
MFKDIAIAALRENGYKITKPREWIVEYLDGNKNHPTALEIFDDIRKSDKSISFATVYNTLDTLVKANIINEITIDSQSSRYDPDTSNHVHFLCEKCKKVIDIHSDKVKPILESMPGKVSGFDIIVRGECDSCIKKS